MGDPPMRSCNPSYKLRCDVSGMTKDIGNTQSIEWRTPPNKSWVSISKVMACVRNETAKHGPPLKPDHTPAFNVPQRATPVPKRVGEAEWPARPDEDPPCPRRSEERLTFAFAFAFAFAFVVELALAPPGPT